MDFDTKRELGSEERTDSGPFSRGTVASPMIACK